ncbi:hypothetical protein V5O48_015905 [Marasmius crinis-equi]|uniref:Uncharacterized protein n=1 Tax=Marasmius crinis-equi TaxID=585013 RepID=A0ABR3ETA2_9AGAR
MAAVMLTGLLRACRFLCWLVLCADANFHLKEQLVSSHLCDPALCDELGYFVRRGPFERWVEENNRVNRSEDEISDCMPFAALSKQNTKFSKGLRYMGIGAVACERTDMVVRIINLNKGERYSVIDYVTGIALQQFMGLLWMILCYDIACQWFINLKQCAPKWPEGTQVPEGLQMEPVIGKLHKPGHKQKNHHMFSLNLIKWQQQNTGAYLGATQHLGEHHKDHETRRMTGSLGGAVQFLELAQTLESSTERWEKQALAHKGLTKNIDENLVRQWKVVVEKWEGAPNPKDQNDLVNPYEIKEEMLSQAKALVKLEAEDEAHARAKLKQKADEQKWEPTLRQSNKLQELRRALRRQIVALLDVRAMYMPGLLQYLSNEGLGDDHDDMLAKDISVWLPLSIPKKGIHRVCGADVVATETKLQFTRANDVLDSL